MNERVAKRQAAKTAEQLLLHSLQTDFEFPSRLAEAILAEAQTHLLGSPGRIKPGQQRVVLVARQAGHGRRLRDTAQVQVVWTVDAGQEDRQVLASQGRVGLRRHRIQRLLSEALEQGALASQEDVAGVLQVSPHTIQRDYAALKAQGAWLPGRGSVRGIGRGQTHKAEIIRRWLHGETYDQLVLHTHHVTASIQRYVLTFVRIIELERQGFTPAQIAQLVQVSEYLVNEYRQVWAENDTPATRERLDEQLQRLAQRGRAKKGGRP